MALTVALIATLALAGPAGNPADVAALRSQSDALFASGDFQGSLEAARQAHALDPKDPWVRYAFLRALAAVDPEAARVALQGAQDPAALAALPTEERARLDTALGYLSLDLGVDAQAAIHFGQVPAGTASHPQAQAGLAILSVRRGHSRQALVYFVSARVSGKLDPPLAELERETRFQIVLHEFGTARDLRDANAAGRAYAALDELRPHHPSTLRARADLAALRGDAPARERALRELLAVDRSAPGAASELVDTLLVQNRPHDALQIARTLAPERLAADRGLQGIERNWVAHFDAAIGSRWRSGATEHDRLELPQLQFAWNGSHPRFGRYRVAADALSPDSDAVPVGQPFGSSLALPGRIDPDGDGGVALQVQWAPTTRFLLELGHTPSSFEVSNLTGALRFRGGTAEGPWSFGLERVAVADSLLSYGGVIDPVTGDKWGGVTRNRAYFGGDSGGDDLALYGKLSGALLDGHRVDDNSQWEAEAGVWKRAVTGEQLARALRRQCPGIRLWRQPLAFHDRARRLLQPAPVPVGRPDLRLARQPRGHEFPARGRRRLAGRARVFQRILSDRPDTAGGKRRSALSGRLTRRRRRAPRRFSRMAGVKSRRGGRQARRRDGRGFRPGPAAGLYAAVVGRHHRATARAAAHAAASGSLRTELRPAQRC